MGRLKEKIKAWKKLTPEQKQARRAERRKRVRAFFKKVGKVMLPFLKEFAVNSIKKGLTKLQNRKKK